jgi:CubicO group peptidase (beta-lactamase class C family)
LAFKGTEYGYTPIRDLLHMSSGVDFGEDRNSGRDLDRLWIDMMGGYGVPAKSTIASIAQFNQRIAAPGTRFFYASIEADVLGAALHFAGGKSASEYLHEKIWYPMGAEADATWAVTDEGLEVAHCCFSAVLRDYARLGRLLAHDGAWEGKQLIPTQWMIDATTVRASDRYLAPGNADPFFGYGYLVWLLPGERRQFALLGLHGQCICVDPRSNDWQGPAGLPAVKEEHQAHGRKSPCADQPSGYLAGDHKAGGSVEPGAPRMGQLL